MKNFHKQLELGTQDDDTGDGNSDGDAPEPVDNSGHQWAKMNEIEIVQ